MACCNFSHNRPFYIVPYAVKIILTCSNMIKIKKEMVLIKPEEIMPSSKKFEVMGVLNPGVVRLDDGNIMVYARVIEKLKKPYDSRYCYAPRMVGKNKFKVKIDKFSKSKISSHSELDFVFKDQTKRLTFISHFRRILLDKTGFNILKIDQQPSFFGIENDGELGVEDPRITRIGNLYVMTYVSLSRLQNISTALAVSKDCINWERKGIIFGEQDKDVVIFPETVNGKYVAFDRPESSFQFSSPHIWIAYSEDLKSWGDLKPIKCVYEEKGSCPRNGAGPPPIKTKKGWLLIYHVVTNHEEVVKETTKSGKKDIRFVSIFKDIMGLKNKKMKDRIIKKRIPFYCVGAALFDLNDPEKLIARSHSLLIVPAKKFDMGTFEEKRVIFPTGVVEDFNKKDLLIYSGGGDVVTTVRKVSLDDILNSLKKEKI
jgi:predicted GH43/DUF377 family glycosyl hydrolase